MKPRITPWTVAAGLLVAGWPWAAGLLVAAALAALVAVHHRRIASWLVWHVPLGPLAPWMMGVAVGRRPDQRALDAASTHLKGGQ